MARNKRGVVLVSGGIDSTTVLALAKSQGFEIYALTFDYGQRHRCELAAARRVAEQLGATRHLIATFDLRAFGGSALTSNAEIPKHRNIHKISSEIPITYVPARNTIFLSFALAWCEVLEASDIFIGANAIDYSGYPDCRPAFIASFENLANLATKAAVEGRAHYHIHAPLLHMSKAQIIRAGYEAGVDFALTHSCYDPDKEGLACGACDSCQLRRQGFRKAGLPDPTHYSNPPR